MDVSENSGTPKSSILIGFSIRNHPFWDTLFLETPRWVETTNAGCIAETLVSSYGFKFRRSAFRGEEPKLTLLAPPQSPQGEARDTFFLNFIIWDANSVRQMFFLKYSFNESF